MKKTIFLIEWAPLCPNFYEKLIPNYIALMQITRSKIYGPIIVLLFLISAIPAYSQMKPEVMKIEVGEILPKEFWSVKHEFYSDGFIKKESLAQYKGKILVIDVWASWCTNCLQSLPKLDSLVINSKGKLNAILLNFSGSGDDFQKVDLVYKRYELDHRKLSYPSILSDTIFRELFSLKTLPQYIWIDRDGRVLAKTGSDFLSLKNVENIYQSAASIDRIIDEKRRKKNEKH